MRDLSCLVGRAPRCPTNCYRPHRVPSRESGSMAYICYKVGDHHMSHSVVWLLDDTKSVSAIAEDPTSNSALMGSHPIVAWVVGSAEPVVPPGWDATLALDANSLREVGQDVADAPADGATAILYDSENWSYTPLIEQETPAASIAHAASLAHS